MTAPTLTPTDHQQEQLDCFCVSHCGRLALICPFDPADCAPRRSTEDVPDEGDSRSAVR